MARTGIGYDSHRFGEGGPMRLGGVDVPADGRWHTVPVLSAAVGLSAEYVCVPSLEPHVFRTVKLDNPAPHALLAGPDRVLAAGIAAIGSGGPYALAAARALAAHTELPAKQIVRSALEVAGEICIYSNRNIEVEEIGPA